MNQLYKCLLSSHSSSSVVREPSETAGNKLHVVLWKYLLLQEGKNLTSRIMVRTAHTSSAVLQSHHFHQSFFPSEENASGFMMWENHCRKDTPLLSSSKSCIWLLPQRKTSFGDHPPWPRCWCRGCAQGGGAGGGGEVCCKRLSFHRVLDRGDAFTSLFSA